MNNSIEYTNGKLIISYAVIQNYLKDLSNMYNVLKGTAGSERLSFIDQTEIIYSKSEDYISFRVLDGQFLPYAETYLLPYTYRAENGQEYKKHAYMMKTMIGTFAIDKDIDTRAILPGSCNILYKYNIADIKGPNARKVSNEIGDFSKIFHINLKENKNIEIPMSQKVYDLISIKSSSEKLTPISMKFDLSTISEIALEEGKNALNKEAKINQNASYKNVRVIYDLPHDKYTCLNKISHIKLTKANKNNEGTTIHFDPDTAKEIIDHLSIPSKLNYKINTKSASAIEIVLPNIFANKLAHRLELTTSEIDTGKSIEIIITEKELPNIDAFILGTVRDEVEKSPLSERQQLTSECMMYLDYVSECTINSSGQCIIASENIDS